VWHKTLWLQQYKPNSLARLLCAVLADWCVCVCVCVSVCSAGGLIPTKKKIKTKSFSYNLNNSVNSKSCANKLTKL